MFNSAGPNPSFPQILLGDRFRVIKLLGQGNFGRTFLAVDESQSNKPRCAIKQFFPQTLGGSSGEAAELFRQEAERLKELGSHPKIPALLDYFEEDNNQYIVQDFIDGLDLEGDLRAEGSFNESQIRQLLNHVLPILDFIHSHKVIHRDIKPQNIIRATDGKLFLVDFGASKFATGTALVKTGTMIGTAAYTAPEQLMGKAVFASDLYSLGITCIHLLTQVEPFDLMDHSEGGWSWQDYLTRPVSQELTQLLNKLLIRGTRQRYQTATGVLQDLNAPPHSEHKEELELLPDKPGLLQHLGKVAVGLGIVGAVGASIFFGGPFLNQKLQTMLRSPEVAVSKVREPACQGDTTFVQVTNAVVLSVGMRSADRGSLSNMTCQVTGFMMLNLMLGFLGVIGYVCYQISYNCQPIAITIEPLISFIVLGGGMFFVTIIMISIL